MSLLLGGAVSSVLGLIGLIFWWPDFITILKGALPIMLLLGGMLAVYIGIDDIQDKLNEERERQEERLVKAKEEIEMVRAEAEQYKEELEKLKEGSREKE